MNRIFYIHSNIVTICCYQTVKECLARKEKVIIITNRGCTWPFFKDKVTIFDFAKMFQGEDQRKVALHSLKAMKDYMNFRRYLSHHNNVVKSIVANEDFYYYMPSMSMVTSVKFVNNKYCKGYYYVDEGYLAYTPAEKLKKYIPNKKKNIIKKLFGIEDHYHLEILSNFKGTVSISQDAFEWNVNGERIVNSVNDYIAEIKEDIPYYSDVILTEYLTQDYEIIIKCIDNVVEMILQDNPKSKIGLKIHPHAITYNREKTISVQTYIKEKYAGIITLIPVDISIEVMSIVYHPRLYSLLELSSIILYAILFNSSKTRLIEYKNNETNIKEISSIDDYNANIVS